MKVGYHRGPRLEGDLTIADPKGSFSGQRNQSLAEQRQEEIDNLTKAGRKHEPRR